MNSQNIILGFIENPNFSL